MADYYQLKNQNIFNPPANTSLGNATNQFDDAYIQNELVLGNVTVTGSTIVSPKVSTITYPGDDTAADPAGGQTITLTGTGFLVGATVLINNIEVSVVSVVSSTTITFTSPANSTGSYILYVINTDGGTAIAIPGIQYSGTPTWTTAAGTLGSLYETQSFNSTVTATGDAPITYSVASGTLPPGATFNSNGTITGTSELLASPTTYTFTVRATDAELQDTNRTFSLTINPDVVTWNSPANNSTYTVTANSAISNVTLSATSAVGSGITYTANALPTGLSLSGDTISGTPTVEANSSSLLTATANTTSESSNITINWTVSVANDAYFEYNTLLIPGASTTFVDDASTNNFAVTVNGDTKPNNFNPYTPGYYSNYFGSGNYISAPLTFGFGTGDFTVEAWVYPNAAYTTYNYIWSNTVSGGLTFYVLGGVLYARTYFVGDLLASSTAPALNTWTHVAVTRSGTTLRIFVNGVQTGSTTNSTNFTTGGSIIGNDGTNAAPWLGYISNLRVVNGTAVYTNNFTPSTTPLTAISDTSLLTCQSNRFIDNSTNVSTITVTGTPQVSSFDPFTPNSSYATYGSGYFDGTGDYLTTTGNTWTQLGTGNFTVEGWCYITSYGSYFPLVDARSAPALTPWLFGVNGSGYADFYGGSAMTRLTDNVAVGLNVWVHLATVRSGSTVTLYVNGVSKATTTYSSAINGGSSTPSIGRLLDPFYATGYISNFRSVIGTAVYTTTFTPPTSPLTAVANTQLLTLQNNQSVNNNVFLDNSTNNFLVTRGGNTTQGTFSPYGGNWSNYFPTTDKLTLTGPNLSGLFSFTFECWVNFTEFGTDRKYFIAVSGGNYYQLVHDSSTGISFRISSGYYKVVGESSNSGWSTGVWYHVALEKSGNNYTIYKNGVSIATGTWASALESVNINYIGGYDSSTGINAYLSNVSFSSNANWQGNFTPSTTPLTSGSNPSQLLLTCQSNRIVDTSTKNYALTPSSGVTVQRFSPFNPASLTPTSYSGYFDGTGDYLTPTASSEYAFGTGDFTVECWIYLPSVPGGEVGFVSTFNTGSGQGFILGTGAGGNAGKLHIGLGNGTGSGNFDLYDSVNVVTNTWIHVAVVRISGTVTLYKNGVSVGSGSGTNNIERTLLGISISYPNSPQGYVTGYISNVRIVKGTGVYTGTFTPSTAPLTAISGTSLLTCQSPTFIDNSTNNFDITVNGNSQPTIQNPFGSTSTATEGYSVSTIGGSGYFDGSGDYLSTPYSTLTTQWWTQNFTIEMWIYNRTNTVSGTDSVPLQLVHGISNSADTYWSFGTNASGQVQFYYYNGGTNWVTSTATAPLSTWNHIAMVYTHSSGNISVYLNGTSVASATKAGTPQNNATSTVNIGAAQNTYYNGSISNLRIVSGTTVYTSNFVPPSAPLTAVQNTVLLTNMTSAGIYDASMISNMETVADAKLSTAVSKFGGSSMYFDGSGDYLSVPNGPQIDLGSGDFTIEMWTYNTGNIGNFSLFGKTNSYELKGDSSRWVWQVNVNSNVFVTNGTLTANTWVHLALVRNGSTTTLYVNGVASASGTSVNANNNTNPLQIGAGPGGTFTGYIDDLRITNGYARYTSNFTPPTSAFPLY